MYGSLLKPDCETRYLRALRSSTVPVQFRLGPLCSREKLEFPADESGCFNNYSREKSDEHQLVVYTMTKEQKRDPKLVKALPHNLPRHRELEPGETRRCFEKQFEVLSDSESNKWDPLNGLLDSAATFSAMSHSWAVKWGFPRDKKLSLQPGKRTMFDSQGCPLLSYGDFEVILSCPHPDQEAGPEKYQVFRVTAQVLPDKIFKNTCKIVLGQDCMYQNGLVTLI